LAIKYTVNGTISLKETDFVGLNQIATPNDTDNRSLFHIRFVESHSFCELAINNHYIALNPQDIVMISSAQPVIVSSLGAPTTLTVYAERLHAPSPLNLVVVGDNPMVHDLMNAGEHDSRFIVYRHLTDQIKHRYLKLLAELERQDLNDVFVDYQREMIVGLLLTELLRNHQATISITDSHFPGNNIRHVSADTQSGIIFTYLVAHSQNATLKTTAAYFGYDQNYFSRLCRKLFNKSFTAQLTVIRIELAKRMLALSNKRIEEIASELGYKNNSSFFAVFKRTVSMTPNDYREQHGYRQQAHINI